ncbi:MAG: hypothetical protein K2X47_00785, partial [Bdellovibrionales bacterium]|nr:hypothetical protein [Bdellovibrionales bacterium]
SGQLFHFYPQGAFQTAPQLHGPLVLSVRPPLRGVLAVPGDADTTAVVNYWLQTTSPILISQDAFIQQLTAFRDVGRRSNFFNAFHNSVDTGAYLTWFAQEPSIPNPFYSLKARALGPRIPTGQNDVDCIVNANVLRLLAKSHQNGVPGSAEACRFLNKIAQEHAFDSCGIYYPNTFYFHLAVTHAYQNQVSCLAPAVDQIQRHILKTQAADGHWGTSAGRRDDLHATLMAVNALLNLRRVSGGVLSSEVRLSVAQGIRWILGQSQLDFQTGHLKWPGGIFFSGFPPLRSIIVWRSEAFTTSLAIRALYEYLISGVQR